MKRCYLVAMESEVQDVFPEARLVQDGQGPFVRYRIDEEREVFQMGVGVVNAAMATQFVCDHFQPQEVVNVGIAGGVSPRVVLGEAYWVERAVFFDVDITAFGYAYGQIAGNGKPFYGLSSAGAKGVVCASGASFISDFGPLQEKLSLMIDVVEMELAAIAHVLSVNGYEGFFGAVKGISDHADGKALTMVKEYGLRAGQSIRRCLNEW